ncbi:hypothetical protein Mgra_00006278 [Meloidogyne graminicola]|uniref:Uncharacterized protein n=1 Tax=Meloidogyne graminicola TaxID=189291 RepID=A0A8S9ZM73_9BILA|nr:hypothetical protein Mgra_00006278 [Meloidogyne graminicola]
MFRTLKRRSFKILIIKRTRLVRTILSILVVLLVNSNRQLCRLKKLLKLLEMSEANLLKSVNYLTPILTSFSFYVLRMLFFAKNWNCMRKQLID